MRISRIVSAYVIINAALIGAINAFRKILTGLISGDPDKEGYLKRILDEMFGSVSHLIIGDYTQIWKNLPYIFKKATGQRTYQQTGVLGPVFDDTIKTLGHISKLDINALETNDAATVANDISFVLTDGMLPLGRSARFIDNITGRKKSATKARRSKRKSKKKYKRTKLYL